MESDGNPHIDPDKIGPEEAILQIITSDLTVITVPTSLQEIQIILFRALNLLPDIPPHLLEFSDQIDHLIEQRKQH